MSLPRANAKMDVTLSNREEAVRPALPSGSASRAFTLIELLVVITVIAILMALLFPAFRGVQDQAKRTQAKNDLTQIVTAVNAFYTEYGKYPLPTDTTGDFIFGPGGNSDPPSNSELFYTLRAINAGTMNANNAANPRQIVFISPPSVKVPTNPRSGIATQAATINCFSVGVGDFVDPWGTPYNVKIDGNYDNQITTNPYGNNNGAGPQPLTIGLIAWSLGSDGVLGTKTTGCTGNNIYTDSDDVISWQ